MIWVAIIEDDHELRDNLNGVLEEAEGFACVGSFPDCEIALQAFEAEQPDVILMDIGLPGMSGVKGTALIKDRYPEIEIIILTVHQDQDSLFQSLRNGASGYLLKNLAPQTLLDAIAEVYQGGSPMSMSIARMVTQSFRTVPPSKPLSERQQQVLKKLCEGKSYQAIANELFISKPTVKFHIRNIYNILQVTNKAEAVRLATKKKWV